MDPHPEPQPAAGAQRRREPLTAVLIVVGIAAIAAGLAIRSSPWAQEKRLKNMSLEDLSLVVLDDPHDAPALYFYGTALLSAGRTQEAETALQLAAKLDPASARAERELAYAELKLNKLPQALESYQSAIRINPKDADAFSGLAHAYAQQGDSAEAVRQMKRAVDLDPRNAARWYSLSKMYADSKDYAGELDALKHSVNLNANQGLYWRELGELNRRESRLVEAEEDLKKAVLLSPNDAIAQLKLGQLYLQSGDSPGLRLDAAKSFQSAIAFDPKMEAAYVGLGTAQMRSREFQPAIAAFRKANELNPSDVDAIRGLGNSLVGAGNVTDGNRLLAAAAKLETSNAEIDTLRDRLASEPTSRPLRLQLARMFRRYGNASEALSQYNAYQNLGAEDTEVRREMAAYQAQQSASASAAQAQMHHTDPVNNGRP